MGMILKSSFDGMVKLAVVEWSRKIGSLWRLTEENFLQCCYIPYLFGSYLSYDVRIFGVQGPLSLLYIAGCTFPAL